MKHEICFSVRKLRQNEGDIGIFKKHVETLHLIEILVQCETSVNEFAAPSNLKEAPKESR